MLVAGHETTGSVLTWTLYLLSKVSSSIFHIFHCIMCLCFSILDAAGQTLAFKFDVNNTETLDKKPVVLLVSQTTITIKRIMS